MTSNYQPAGVHDIEAQSSPSKKAKVDFKWTNVNFTVGKKSILTNCWGEVPSGKVCAIMGPSGAGKSSLLNVLAGRSAPAPGVEIDGRITVSDKVINPVSYRQNIAYVMQDDALYATSTPREALEFSAILRLPPETPREEIKKLVDKLLDELGLSVCADVMIGGALIKGISGGQRKRTSVGIELITNPSLLFLDEPTSGLDSYTAYNIVNLLRTCATDNTAILCTIHQPSSEVFFLFDIVIFMNNGRIFYHGPTSEIVNHFSKCGYNCPANYNPSDYIMFINQTEDVSKLEQSGVFMHTAPHHLLPKDTSKSNLMLTEKAVGIKAPWYSQLELLVKREIVNTKRDVAALGARFGITIILNLLYGLIFFQVGSKSNANPTNFNAHFGGLTMVAVFAMFGTAQPVMLNFPFERPMFLREYSTGTYSAVSYFLSKMVIELPLTFLQILVQFILVYFLMDLQGNFIYLVLACWGLGIVSASVAVVLGCAVSDVKDVTEMAPLLFVPQLLFAGFFIRLSQVPVFLRWAQYLCGLKYTMNLLLATEFDPSLPSCQGASSAACHNVLDFNQVNTNLIWLYIFLLFVLFVSFRSIGAAILVQKAKRFY